MHGHDNSRKQYNNYRGDHYNGEKNMGSQNNPLKSNCHHCSMKGASIIIVV